MINVVGELKDAWFELLGNGNISVPYYRSDADIAEDGDYVVGRVEGETNERNKHLFITNPAVMIIDIVTRHAQLIDDSRVESIEGEILALAIPTPSTNGLSVASMQIVNVERSSTTYLDEDNGTFKIQRKIIRFSHLINEN